MIAMHFHQCRHIAGVKLGTLPDTDLFKTLATFTADKNLSLKDAAVKASAEKGNDAQPSTAVMVSGFPALPKS